MFVPVLSDAGFAPALGLDFTTGTIDPRITFSRLSVARFYNNAGILTQASLNAPRFDYNPSTLVLNGFLMEEARTNLLLQSNAFGTTWTLGTDAALSSAAAISPDGSTNAWKLKEGTTATSSSHQVQQDVTKAASALAYSTTVFAKAAERTRIALVPSDGANGSYAVFDLSGGQVGPTGTFVGTGFTAVTSSIQSVGNGWYRCTINVTSTAATTIRTEFLLDAGSGTNALTVSYAGTVGSGALIYGAQLEQATYGTSYIPTTTGAAARSADTATILTTSFPWNAITGGVFCQFIGQNSPSTTPRIIGTNAASNAAALLFGLQQAGFYDGTNATSTGSGSLGVVNKSATSWGTSQVVVAFNGGILDGPVPLATVMSAITTLSLNTQGGGATPASGMWFQKLTFYNRQLSDTSIRVLTT